MSKLVAIYSTPSIKINSHFLFNCLNKTIKIVAIAVKLEVTATMDRTNVAINIIFLLRQQ